MTVKELPTPDVVNEKQIGYSIQPGYKQTELGLLPEDWEVTKIGDISSPVRGGSPRPAGDPRFFNGSFIPWLTVAGLTNIPNAQMVVSTTSAKLTEEGALRSRTLYPETLIIANSGATLGVAKILGITCCANDGIAALLGLSKRVSNRYLVHYINTKTEYLRDVVATGNGQPNLNTELIAEFKVPLPPTLAEQEAIAEALGDADSLVESLERLLAKKRHLKQAAMQQLLTGKKRLPGFDSATMQETEVGLLPKDWSFAPISQIADVKTGPFGSALHQKDYVDDGTPIITVEHLGERSITRQNLPMVSDADRKRLAIYVLQKGDVVFSRVGSVDRNALVTQSEAGWLFSGRLLRLRPDARRIDSSYLSFHFHTDAFKNRMYAIAVGQTMASLNTKLLGSVVIAIPTKREQTAIATVLSDMDEEIVAIEAKILKARQIKAGMMQELLTGKTRLVSGGPAS